MIISRGRSYIFVHIPKTGGTSLALALEARMMGDDLILGDTPKALKQRRKLKKAEARGRLWKHSTLADIEGLVSREEMQGMLRFTLVRNPWDRMVSYYHWLKEQSFDHPAVATAKTLGFSEFLRAPAVWGPVKLHPYASYMRASDGSAHEALYIRLEHFAQDAAPLAEHLGFELDMPWVNESARRRDYRSYYNAQDTKAVAETCAEDIEKFNYSFD
ncbi:sulfotransferase family protein [Lentibacter sp. XHP0401]|jgi:Sulfotransferase family|uniref:sulfotransferase family protein n=1 Tax=Lentibacter sp. XHP0401 TaxID=2984334 RepID=UPI0021E99445|nr:sulfotransferase family protein [Lentibacter sp. XHP0401]MCV2893127.1 sulfotransferase family protein [Lentibacter sp. XHP0401]